MRSVESLLDEVARSFAPMAVVLRREGTDFVANLVRQDGTIVWPDYAHASSETMAILAAEQRYLAEEVGSGSLIGHTYAEKAAERLRRHLQGDNATH